MIPSELGGATDAIRQWLHLGRHVLISGDIGAGKSTVLGALVQDATRSGRDALCIAGNSILGNVPFGALLSHDSVVRTRAGERPSAHALALLLNDELSGSQNILAVDNLELLDTGSAQVLEKLTARPDVRLVATLRRDFSGDALSPGRQLAAGLDVAEVGVPPLGFRGMAALLASRLQGTPDAGLISSIVARSAGNPGVAVALLDSGRFSGAIDFVDGIWTEIRPPDAGPDEIVIRTLTKWLPAEAVEALEMLAWSGPVTLDHALQLVGSAALTALGRQERVTVFRTSRGENVTVSPPALARALRTRLSLVQRRLLTHQAENVFGSAYEPVALVRSELVEQLVFSRAVEDDAQVANLAELTALVHERAAVQDASRRADWRADPAVGVAVDFLDSLMARPTIDHLDEVFRETRVRPSDSAGEVAAFRMRQAQWMLWQRQDLEEVEDFLLEASRSLGPTGQLLQAQALIFRYSSTGQNLGTDFLDHLEVGPASSPASIWVSLVRAGLLLEMGEGEKSLEVLDGVPELEAQSPLMHYLGAARSDALLLLGQVKAAERYARRLLEDSYANLDPLGIRLHSLKLAEVLYLTGHSETAWQALSSSLRLGPPSPFGIAYYERTLALGAVIRADAGDLDLARVLEREMDDYPLTYRPVLGSMRPWAKAAILFAEQETAAAESLLSEQFALDTAGNSLASALLVGTARRTPYTPQEADELQRVYDRAPLPLFEPLVHLHLAMAQGDEGPMLAALEAITIDPGDHLSRMVLDVIDAQRLRAGSKPLSQEAIDALDNPKLVRHRSNRALAPLTSTLTDREYEVALLARSGMPNREIANRLFISVRTVENHMYRLVRKLGLERREDLRDKWSESQDSPDPSK